jgi:hypothetical protein
MLRKYQIGARPLSSISFSICSSSVILPFSTVCSHRCWQCHKLNHKNFIMSYIHYYPYPYLLLISCFWISPHFQMLWMRSLCWILSRIWSQLLLLNILFSLLTFVDQ